MLSKCPLGTEVTTRNKEICVSSHGRREGEILMEILALPLINYVIQVKVSNPYEP